MPFILDCPCPSLWYNELYWAFIVFCSTWYEMEVASSITLRIIEAWEDFSLVLWKMFLISTYSFVCLLQQFCWLAFLIWYRLLTDHIEENLGKDASLAQDKIVVFLNVSSSFLAKSRRSQQNGTLPNLVRLIDVICFISWESGVMMLHK